MKVGIPCLKCSLSPSNQVNSKTGKSSKTCGVGSAWREMNDERLGRDTTIDKDMTHLNVWMDGASSDEVEDIVKDCVAQVNKERKANGLRSLRKDAVTVVEIVEKPPIEYMQNLSYCDRVKFLQNSHEVMEKIIKEWNPNWKIIESVQHHDEFGGLSAHNHTLVMMTTKDKNGIANFNAKTEMNLKFFNHVNSQYPKLMRERGYEVEDCKTYDRLSEEEKLERKLNPKEHGVDAYTFKRKKIEEMNSQIESKKVEFDMVSKEYERKVVEITEAPSLLKYDDIIKENESLKVELSLKDKLIQTLNEKIDNLKTAFDNVKSNLENLTKNLGSRFLAKFGVETDNDRYINPFPSKDAQNAFKTISGELHEKDIHNYRVIPDFNNKDKYQITYRNKKGDYETIKDNIASREAAEALKKSIIDSHLDIVKDLKFKIK